MKTNVLYYGDNLHMLQNRDYFPDESVDLIYLDPPFNSNRSYNVLFQEETGAGSPAQIEAFEDTWHWAGAAEPYDEMIRGPHQNVARILKALVEGLGHNQVTAYLTMMAIRLVELHRVLKPTGSIYLHCDPTAGHYLRLVMDSIFDPRHFVNEIVWKRSDAHSDIGQGARHLGRVHDILLFYRKASKATYNPVFNPLPDSTVANWYRNVEPGTGRLYNKADLSGPGGAAKGSPVFEWNGVTRAWRFSKTRMEELDKQGKLVYSKSGMAYLKRYLDESKGVPLQDWWDDISMLRGIQKGERLGYATQKPLALLERIIQISSSRDDIVLDPFCGCGTAVHAAQKLGRRWIGIDVTHLAIGLIRRRMQDAFPGVKIEVVGEPVDLPGATELAHRDKYQFQWWALDRIGAQPVAGKKKGSDKGIDGVIPFYAGKDEYKRAIVSVKGGETVGVGAVRDLVGVLEREGEPVGVLVTLTKPTKDMQTEAAAAGFYESEFWERKYPRVQILTIADVLNGKRPDVPWGAAPFAKAPVEKERAEQDTLL